MEAPPSLLMVPPLSAVVSVIAKGESVINTGKEICGAGLLKEKKMSIKKEETINNLKKIIKYNEGLTGIAAQVFPDFTICSSM